MEILAVFKIRSDAVKIARALKFDKIPCSLVATPSYLRLGCGLSVLFKRGYEGRVKEIVSLLGADSFYGFFAKK